MKQKFVTAVDVLKHSKNPKLKNNKQQTTKINYILKKNSKIEKKKRKTTILFSFKFKSI